jgi:hypothetical protein
VNQLRLISCTASSWWWCKGAASDIESSPWECVWSSPEMTEGCCFPSLCNVPEIGLGSHANHLSHS